MEIDPNASIVDSSTSLLGVNHIGLSVKNLEDTLAFYQGVSGYPLVRRETVRDCTDSDTLLGHTGVEYEVAVLKAPNMLFEFFAFKHNADESARRMPPQGPGMTHTCFQTSSSDSGYDRFRTAGADILTRGDDPIDLGGYGVTYAYGYDPEGNMFEMEQLDSGPLASVPSKGRWISQGHSMWMTQVALVTHDLERLTAWYEKVLGFAPNRRGDFENQPRMDEVVDYDDLSLKASWFKMDQTTKSLEIWQYRNPETPSSSGKRAVTALGYFYSLEVGDIHAEYTRMLELGVDFVSAPLLIGDCWQVFAHDIDGNVFALRQWVDADSQYSLRKLEA